MFVKGSLHRITRLLTFLSGLLIVIPVSGYADWVIQVGASPDRGLLEADIRRFQGKLGELAVMQVGRHYKLVSAQRYVSVASAQPTLTAVKSVIPGAFLRRVDEEVSVSSAPENTSVAQVAAPLVVDQDKTAYPVSVREIGNAPAVVESSSNYHPAVWIKR